MPSRDPVRDPACVCCKHTPTGSPHEWHLGGLTIHDMRTVVNVYAAETDGRRVGMATMACAKTWVPHSSARTIRPQKPDDVCARVCLHRASRSNFSSNAQLSNTRVV